ncbi:MAG: hypothetical protein Q9174_003400 [Haloplaca sp. 1 TL-2023]
MLLPRYLTVAVGASLAHAFTDTSPFFMFSTSELLADLPQIASADKIRDTVVSQLSKCLSDTYIVVTQPGVHAEDYSDRYAAPHLRKHISGEDERSRSSASVPDVLGSVDTDGIVQEVEKTCEAALLKVDASSQSPPSSGTLNQVRWQPDDPHPRVINLEFPTLPTDPKKRATKLKDNDAFLSSILSTLPTSKYTVIYTTTPSTTPPSAAMHHDHLDQQIYEMDTSFSSQHHMEIKRDVDGHTVMGKRAENISLPDAPLFERYQYFSPGIFMGLLIMLPLFLILYVGISGVGSLQVSYAAFDREMGPAAHKKQQ